MERFRRRWAPEQAGRLRIAMALAAAGQTRTICDRRGRVAAVVVWILSDAARESAGITGADPREVNAPAGAHLTVIDLMTNGTLSLAEVLTDFRRLCFPRYLSATIGPAVPVADAERVMCSSDEIVDLLRDRLDEALQDTPVEQGACSVVFSGTIRRMLFVSSDGRPKSRSARRLLITVPHGLVRPHPEVVALFARPEERSRNRAAVLERLPIRSVIRDRSNQLFETAALAVLSGYGAHCPHVSDTAEAFCQRFAGLELSALFDSRSIRVGDLPGLRAGEGTAPIYTAGIALPALAL